MSSKLEGPMVLLSVFLISAMGVVSVISLNPVKDTDTCCQPMLKCNEGKFKCPVSHDFKGNAGDLYCRDVARVVIAQKIFTLIPILSGT